LDRPRRFFNGEEDPVHNEPRESGFTLIELLVVMIIIGILAGIAIPVYLKQRESAHRTQAVSDMRNAAEAVETYVATDPIGRSYADLDGATEASAVLRGEGLVTAPWTQLTIHTEGPGYCIDGTHTLLPGRTLVWRNSVGVVDVGATGAVSCA
jgi:type IV pilus assembly protein PilA